MNYNLKFEVELYVGLLIQASELYEMNRFDRLDPKLVCASLNEREKSLERQIDALIVGREMAMETCRKQVIKGGFGELYAAIRVFCRQKRLDLVIETIGLIQPDDEERVQATVDALMYEVLNEWHSEIVSWLQKEDPKWISIAAAVIARHRINVPDQLFETAGGVEDDFALRQICRALGRIRYRSAISVLMRGLQSNEPQLQREATIALLRNGDNRQLDDSVGNILGHSWGWMALGLAGNSRQTQEIQDYSLNRSLNAEQLLTLGLLGSVSSIEFLLQQLPKADLAENAAIALNLITGAELYEEKFIPEEIDEDELFEDELEKLRNGEPLYPPGEEPGETITRLSQDFSAWNSWWQRHHGQFYPQLRYRHGQLYRPQVLLQGLWAEGSPNRLRELFAEELVIRYEIDFHFEIDMPVVDQKRRLTELGERLSQIGDRFEPGCWYFAGQRMG